MDAFDVFCPTCNILVSAKVIASGRGGYRADAPRELQELDVPFAEYHGERYFVALCGRRDDPFLVRGSRFDTGDSSTITNTKVLFPSEGRQLIQGLPDAVNRAYEQAARSFAVGLYEPATLMCRKALEAVCALKGANGRSLYERLAQLERLSIIDARLLAWAHEIRLVANDAAHDADTEVTKDDGRDVLDLTEAILLYVFSLTTRFDKFRARRQSK